MTRAILTCFHAYTPFGQAFYEPILDFYLQQMRKYADEYDMLYLLEDDNWRIDPAKLEGMKAKIIHVDPHLRYYDAYKSVLPQIGEELVLFLDDDMVIYKEGVIGSTFDLLLPYGLAATHIDVVSIYDTCGEYKTNKLNGGNKFCLYFFATRKELLIKYLDIDWGPHMPHSETIGLLTEAMLIDGIKPYEFEEDKSNILLNIKEHGALMFYDANNGKMKSKNLRYYHVRAGSTPAYLLATKKYGDIDTYNSYLKNQPRSEYLRQMAWYYIMTLGMKDESDPSMGILDFLNDCGISIEDWSHYIDRFIEYHGLKL